jgi:hypothetical protein
MADEKGKGGLGGSVTIPGTKKKVPVLLIIVGGAALIAAYLIIKGGGSASPDVSSAPDTSGNTDTTGTNDTVTSAITGAIETMSQRIQAIEEQLAGGTTGGTPGAPELGSGSAAPGAGDIPTSDPAMAAASIVEIGENINPKAIVEQGAQANAFTVAMPPAAPGLHGVSPVTAPAVVKSQPKLLQQVQEAVQSGVNKLTKQITRAPSAAPVQSAPATPAPVGSSLNVKTSQLTVKKATPTSGPNYNPYGGKK